MRLEKERKREKGEVRWGEVGGGNHSHLGPKTKSGLPEAMV